jgi:predicted dehydrogenase
MADELRVGLVGCGRLAEVGYLPALRAARGVVLVAAADPDPARRARVAALAGGAPEFPDTAALLREVPVDGLVLATPAAAHLADARAAAAAGVAVLVEKPPAVDRWEAAELAALTPPPWIGFNRRFDPAVGELRSATPAGEPVELLLELHYRRPAWGAHTVRDDALLDLGPHLVDLARWLTRSEVTAVSRTAVSPERAAFELELGPARARIRCATDRPHHERLELRDQDGIVLGRHRQGGLLAGVWGRLVPRRGPHPLVASLVGQLEAFGRAARGAAEPVLGSAADGVAVMTTVDAVRSATVGESQPVPVTEE